MIVEIPSTLPLKLEDRPRFVRRIGIGHGFYLFATRLAAVVGCIASICLAIPLIGDVGVAVAGAERQGTIIGVRAPSGFGPFVRYIVGYRVPVGRGIENYTCTASADQLAALGVPNGPWKAPEGSDNKIRARVWRVGTIYVQEGLPPGQWLWSWPAIEFVPTALAVTLTAVFVWLGMVKPSGTRRLYRTGAAVPGVILAKRKSGPMGLIPRLDYAFVAPDGKQALASLKVFPGVWAEAREGQAVTVLHPDGASQPSVIYEFAGFACV